jgi:hypothetical protein
MKLSPSFGTSKWVDETFETHLLQNISFRNALAASLARSIKNYFAGKGTISSFTCIGNVDALSKEKRRALYESGVEVKDVPSGTADAADVQIVIELSKVCFGLNFILLLARVYYPSPYRSFTLERLRFPPNDEVDEM